MMVAFRWGQLLERLFRKIKPWHTEGDVDAQATAPYQIQSLQTRAGSFGVIVALRYERCEFTLGLKWHVRKKAD
jgi:hypothetical protein